MTDLAFAVWQISSGPVSGASAEVFLRHGVALIGPGDAGAGNPERDDDEFEGGFVRRFARALGWPPERIAVQSRQIDVAVFRTRRRTPENCHLVIDAKRLGAGVECAIDQYVEALGLPRDVIVTDGIRYRVYAGGCDFAPMVYMPISPD